MSPVHTAVTTSAKASLLDLLGRIAIGRLERGDRTLRRPPAI